MTVDALNQNGYAQGKLIQPAVPATGYGIVPTRYLVDKTGRVQLITMATINWALT